MKTAKGHSLLAGSHRWSLLFSKEDLCHVSRNGRSLPGFALRSFVGFVNSILDPGFPCVFAAPGFWRGLYRYGFISDARSSSAAEELARILVQYLNWIQTVPSEDEHLAVLIVFTEPMGDLGSTAYRRLFESLLVTLNLHDPAPWPDSIPRSSADPKNSFCFGGRQLFMNCNSPSHHRRRSRNLGDSMTLVIQPRDVFDRIVTEKMRGSIRARIPTYDGIPMSPEIGAYVDQDNREHAGYFLSETNEGAKQHVAEVSRCPYFHAASEEDKALYRRCPWHRFLALIRKGVRLLSAML